MRFSLPRLTGALLLAVLGALGCSDSNSPSGTGKLTLLLKDAPGDIQAAVVTIAEVNLQGSGGKTVLRSTPVTTDLLTLTTDVQTLVDAAVIPAGTYTQLRFVITGGYIQVDNGDGTSSIYASDPNYDGLPAGAVVTGQLRMPSFSTSGLKVTLPGNALTIANDLEEILVVDFDVSQSFGHVAGNSGAWVMHPVVTATRITTTGSASVAFTLGAGVTLPGGATLADLSATLTGTDGILHTASFTDPLATGTFTAKFALLAPGDYTLIVTLPAGVVTMTTDPLLPVGLTVQAGETTALSFTVTAAT
jgi:Domain of unknown function (DUF4382)